MAPQLAGTLDRVTKLQDLLTQRYGAQAPHPNAELNPTLETILEHRSVRKFLDKPITDAQLELIIAAAQAASTSSSLQGWSVIVVRDPAKVQRIADGCGNSGSFIPSASLLLVWVIDYARAAHIIEREGGSSNTFDLIENTVLGFTDIGIASQNALLAAESLGLGGVYLGSLRNDIPAVIETLHLPKYVFPTVGLALGHPDPTEGTGVKPRLGQRAVVHVDAYDESAWREASDAYDAEFGAYYKTQGVENARWTRTVAKRLGDPQQLSGRQHLRQHLESQGLDSK